MAEIREIASGLQFPEGPIAMPDGSVILVEIKRGTLSRVTSDGKIEVVAETGGGCSPGEAADERPGGEGAHEQAGSRLREVERVREVGQERRERRVEHRVQPDERGDQQEQTAHCHAA